MEVFSFILLAVAATCSALCLALVLSFILRRDGEETWVRDGRKPPGGSEHDLLSIPVLVIEKGHTGIGYWDSKHEDWVVDWGQGEEKEKRVGEVEAWQKFPEYEKIEPTPYGRARFGPLLNL